MLRKIKLLILSFLLPITTLAVKIETPLKDDAQQKGIAGLLKTILKSILELAIPIIVLAIIYVGFLFVKAQGNDSELSKAKQALVYVLIGTAIIIASNALYNIFFAAL